MLKVLYNIYNIKVLLVAVVLFVGAAPLLHAQTRKVMNRPYIDQRPYHYGFLAGINLQDIEFVNNGFTDEEGNQWFTDVANYDPGFSVGILAELNLHPNIALRVIPTMHFGEKTTTFLNQKTGDRLFQNMKSTYISIPVDVKFSGERFNNYRPYVMCGVNPIYDLTVKKQRNLLLKTFDCFLEVGLGCDFYMPFFKFIPEIKFCYGLSNIINKRRDDITEATPMIYTNSVDRGRNKMVVITFYIE